MTATGRATAEPAQAQQLLADRSAPSAVGSAQARCPARDRQAVSGRIAGTSGSHAGVAGGLGPLSKFLKGQAATRFSAARRSDEVNVGRTCGPVKRWRLVKGYRLGDASVSGWKLWRGLARKSAAKYRYLQGRCDKDGLETPEPLLALKSGFALDWSLVMNVG